mmetsp:Transcript_13857/g.23412  ORF Transcript_13857/g.23412 Transcript_13857/m.23412 type:complete len:295 (-) Transcript_13857:237-1121(-)
MFTRPTATSPCERTGRPAGQSGAVLSPTGRTTVYRNPDSLTRCSSSRWRSRVPKGLRRTIGMSTTVFSTFFFAADQARRVTAADDSTTTLEMLSSALLASDRFSAAQMRSTGVRSFLLRPKRPLKSCIGVSFSSCPDTHHSTTSIPAHAFATLASSRRSHTATSSTLSAAASLNISEAFSASRTTARTWATSVEGSCSSCLTVALPMRPVAPNTATLSATFSAGAAPAGPFPFFFAGPFPKTAVTARRAGRAMCVDCAELDRDFKAELELDVMLEVASPLLRVVWLARSAVVKP